MIECNSSTIQSYRGMKSGDEPSNDLITLYVKFKTGKIYRYFVPEKTYEDLLITESKGKYINVMKKTFDGVLQTEEEVSKKLESLNQKKSKPAAKRAVNKNIFDIHPEFSYFF